MDHFADVPNRWGALRKNIFEACPPPKRCSELLGEFLPLAPRFGGLSEGFIDRHFLRFRGPVSCRIEHENKIPDAAHRGNSGGDIRPESGKHHQEGLGLLLPKEPRAAGVLWGEERVPDPRERAFARLHLGGEVGGFVRRVRATDADAFLCRVAERIDEIRTAVQVQTARLPQGQRRLGLGRDRTTPTATTRCGLLRLLLCTSVSPAFGGLAPSFWMSFFPSPPVPRFGVVPRGWTGGEGKKLTTTKTKDGSSDDCLVKVKAKNYKDGEAPVLKDNLEYGADSALVALRQLVQDPHITDCDVHRAQTGANKFAAYQKDEKLTFDMVASSSLRRAMETAQMMFRRNPTSLAEAESNGEGNESEIFPMPFINELNEDTLIQPENYALDLKEQQSTVNEVLAPVMNDNPLYSQVVLKDNFSKGLPKIEQQWDKVRFFWYELPAVCWSITFTHDLYCCRIVLSPILINSSSYIFVAM